MTARDASVDRCACGASTATPPTCAACDPPRRAWLGRTAASPTLVPGDRVRVTVQGRVVVGRVTAARNLGEGGGGWELTLTRDDDGLPERWRQPVEGGEVERLDVRTRGRTRTTEAP